MTNIPLLHDYKILKSTQSLLWYIKGENMKFKAFPEHSHLWCLIDNLRNDETSTVAAIAMEDKVNPQRSVSGYSLKDKRKSHYIYYYLPNWIIIC